MMSFGIDDVCGLIPVDEKRLQLVSLDENRLVPLVRLPETNRFALAYLLVVTAF